MVEGAPQGNEAPCDENLIRVVEEGREEGGRGAGGNLGMGGQGGEGCPAWQPLRWQRPVPWLSWCELEEAWRRGEVGGRRGELCVCVEVCVCVCTCVCVCVCV